MTLIKFSLGNSAWVVFTFLVISLTLFHLQRKPRSFMKLYTLEGFVWELLSKFVVDNAAKLSFAWHFTGEHSELDEKLCRFQKHWKKSLTNHQTSFWCHEKPWNITRIVVLSSKINSLNLKLDWFELIFFKMFRCFYLLKHFSDFVTSF